MAGQDYTITILVDKSPEEAFRASTMSVDGGMEKSVGILTNSVLYLCIGMKLFTTPSKK